MTTTTVQQQSTNGDFETLVKELNHRVWEVRRDACEGLAVLGDPRAVGRIVVLLQDSVGAVRYAAAEALGKLGDKTSIVYLLQMLENPKFGSYAPVIEALANLRSKEAIPYCIRMLSDQDAHTRGLAANALMVITRQVIPFKAKGSDQDREVSIRLWENWWQKNQHAL